MKRTRVAEGVVESGGVEAGLVEQIPDGGAVVAARPEVMHRGVQDRSLLELLPRPRHKGTPRHQRRHELGTAGFSNLRDRQGRAGRTRIPRYRLQAPSRAGRHRREPEVASTQLTTYAVQSQRRLPVNLADREFIVGDTYMIADMSA